mgnify:CR=1 FL=1
MKLNYPIVYGLMPIVEPAGWVPVLNELERQYDTACYIVSKCFLIGEKSTYTENGKKKLTYEVVFPYQRSHSTWEYSIPTYNLIHGHCTNSEYVDAIFDSCDDAKKYKDEKNQVLCQKTWINLPITEHFLEEKKKKEQEFYDKVKKYELLERQLLLNLAKLSNEKRKELDFVISREKCILPFHLYEFIQFYHDKEYLVYSVDRKQYDLLCKTYQEKDIQNAKPLLLGDSHITRLICEETKGCYYFDDHLLKYSNTMPVVNNSEILNVQEYAHRFYTTETACDIIDSFYPYKSISLERLLKKKK